MNSADDPNSKPHSGIVIAGAGGLGSEIRDALDCESSTSPFVGYLDDVPGPNVIGPISPEVVPESCHLILAIGDGRTRHSLVRRFANFDRWATVFHPKSFVSPRAAIGHGCYVGAFAYVGPGAVLGRHSIVNIQSQVGHDAKFGAFVTLSPYAATNGAVTLGDGVFLATAATVAPGVKIGSWTNAAAGSRVTKDIPSLHLVHGNPAKGRELYDLPPER
jgi:sugar O-acyltransferase (sialic acid O-acetyltransferase NeuD family)